MKRKAIALLLAAAMGLSLCACGKTSGSEATKDDNDNDVPVDNGESDASESKGISGEEPIFAVTSGVSEDRIWVEFGEGESHSQALIDTDGNALFVSDHVGDHTEVHNGVTFCTIHAPGSGEYNNDLYILDKDGKEITNFVDSETRYDILAAEGGNCLLYEYKGSSHKLCFMNSKGEIYYSRDIDSNASKWLSLTSQSVVKAGEGIYVVRLFDEASNTSHIYLANFNTPNVVHSTNQKRFKFRLGCIVFDGDDGASYYQALPIEAYADDAAFEAALDKVLEGEKYYTAGENRNLYDMKSATKGATIKYIFEDYLVSEMCTLDGYVYLSLCDRSLEKGFYVVIDINGNKLYDIKPMDKDLKIIDMIDGNLICKDGVILKTGEKVGFDKLPSDLKLSRDIYFSYGCFANTGDRSLKEDHNTGVFGYTSFYGGIMNGYYIPRPEMEEDAMEMKFPNSIQTLDGSKVVTTVKVG